MAVRVPDKQAMDDRPLVLVVNDDTDLLRLMEQLLEDQGYRAETLKSTKGAIDHLAALIRRALFRTDRRRSEQSGRSG